MPWVRSFSTPFMIAVLHWFARQGDPSEPPSNASGEPPYNALTGSPDVRAPMTPLLLAASIFFADAWAAPEVATEKADMPPLRPELSFRGRMMGATKSILDIWYTDKADAEEDGVDWPVEDPRPDIKGYTLGLEYTIKSKNTNGIFYFDYFDSTMTHGYFDDRDEDDTSGETTGNDYHDGHYLAPTKNFGFVTFGADFAYEIHMVRTENTKGIFGLSLLPGAGLGLMVVTGHLDQWKPDDLVEGQDESVGSAYVKYYNGQEPDAEVAIPPVLPMVDINLSLRMNFANRIVLRFEGGLHNMFYYGATAGVMF